MKRNLYLFLIIGLLAAPAAFAQSGKSLNNPVTAVEKLTMKITEIEISEQLPELNSRWINGLCYNMNGSRKISNNYIYSTRCFITTYYVNGIKKIGPEVYMASLAFSINPEQQLRGVSASNNSFEPEPASVYNSFSNQQYIFSDKIEPMRNSFSNLIPKP
ncbi:MAG: hypothetical protein LPJ89_07325 [Hymenobacteraceae bacterium]|nr:hypothetical protein [Hymenobacteraceae bacterium]